jgi:outer membrane protein
VEAARADETRVVQEVVLNTTEAYFDLLKQERLLGVAQQALQQMEAHQATARSFYEVGLIPKNDLLFAELKVADGQQNLVRAENAVQMSRARLNTILRRDIESPVEVEDILQYVPFEKEFTECLQAGYEHRPEIAYYSVRLDQAKRLVNVARSDFFPTLSVVGNYSRYGDTPGVSGSSYRDQEDWSVAGVAEWNFWQWGKTKFAVDAGLSRQNQASDSLSSIRDQITLEIKSSYLLMREAEKHIFVAEKAIERAEENYRINVERFKEQVARSTDVVDAQTLMTQTKSDYYNALSNYHIAMARLEHAMGTNYAMADTEAGTPPDMQ